MRLARTVAFAAIACVGLAASIVAGFGTATAQASTSAVFTVKVAGTDESTGRLCKTAVYGAKGVYFVNPGALINPGGRDYDIWLTRKRGSRRVGLVGARFTTQLFVPRKGRWVASGKPIPCSTGKGGYAWGTMSNSTDGGIMVQLRYTGSGQSGPSTLNLFWLKPRGADFLTDPEVHRVPRSSSRAKVELSLIDDNGRPLSGQRVSLARTSMHGGFVWSARWIGWTRTDARGVAHFDVGIGNYRVLYEEARSKVPPAPLGAMADFAVVQGAARAPTRLAVTSVNSLGAEAGLHQGRVYHQQGSYFANTRHLSRYDFALTLTYRRRGHQYGLANTTLVEALTPLSDGGSFGSETKTKVTTDANGVARGNLLLPRDSGGYPARPREAMVEFRFAGSKTMSPATFRLFALSPTSVQLTPTKPFVAASPNATVVACVGLTDKGGHALANRTVRVSDGSGWVGSALTDASGAVRYDLPVGDYTAWYDGESTSWNVPPAPIGAQCSFSVEPPDLALSDLSVAVETAADFPGKVLLAASAHAGGPPAAFPVWVSFALHGADGRNLFAGMSTEDSFLSPGSFGWTTDPLSPSDIVNPVTLHVTLSGAGGFGDRSADATFSVPAGRGP